MEYQLRYQKKGSRVLIGGYTIPDHLIKDYVGTLCFSTQTEIGTDENESVDIACSREQLEGLVAAVSHYLEYTAKYPPHKEREAF